MLPRPADSIGSRPALHIRKVVSKLVSITTRQPSSVHSCTGPSPKRRPLIPTTLTNTSRRPKWSSAIATAAAAAPCSHRSAWNAMAEGISAQMASRLVVSRSSIKIRWPAAAKIRAVAAAIPEAPVMRVAAGVARSAIHHLHPVAVVVITIFKALPGCFGAHHVCTRQHQRRLAATGQFGRNEAFHGVDDCGIADGTARSNGHVDPWDLDHRIAGRRAVVDHQVCYVREFLSRRMAARQQAGVFGGDDTDDFHTSGLCTQGNIHHDSVGPGGGEDHHQVIRAEHEVGKNDLSQSFLPPDPHGLPLTVGTHYLC